MPTIDNWRALREALLSDALTMELAGQHDSVTEDIRKASAAIRALLDERDRLAAEVEALRADAGRYRWLRHGDNDAEVMVFDNQTRASPENVWLPRLDELDAAIDAAMKGKP